jgi:uncharacterized protein YndB with AHSA1/START domain
MDHTLTVSGSIEINASPQKVWDALTKPELIKDYLFGTETVTDWKVGSEIIFQGEYEGHKYRDKGILLDVTPLKSISYTYWSGFSGLEDKPENYSVVTYQLEHQGGKTKFTWSQKGFASEQSYQHSKQGMDELLKKIKEVAER